MSAAAWWLWETARMAVPTLVRSTTNSSAPSKARVNPTTTTSLLETTTPPAVNVVAGNVSGNAAGVAPNTSCPRFCNSIDTPIAVMSTVSLERSRRGL